jgi:hypothetical protein
MHVNNIRIIREFLEMLNITPSGPEQVSCSYSNNWIKVDFWTFLFVLFGFYHMN